MKLIVIGNIRFYDYLKIQDFFVKFLLIIMDLHAQYIKYGCKTKVSEGFGGKSR